MTWLGRPFTTFAIFLSTPLACGQARSGGSAWIDSGSSGTDGVGSDASLTDASGSGEASSPATGADAGAPGGDAGGVAGRGSLSDSGGEANAPDGQAQAFIHPGLLHSALDFDRMTAKVAAGAQPWKTGWDKLAANAHSSLSWTPKPAAVVYRGLDGIHAENYGQLYNDVAAAYALALRWKISGDAAYADRSVQILNAWSAVLTGIGGNTDKFLAAGLYGYEFANAAEIMRTYAGWLTPDVERFKSMMRQVFYPMNHDFLARHNGDQCVTHFYANWDICNMASMLAIGVLSDDTMIYNEAIDYFKNGAGNGSIANAVYYLHPEIWGSGKRAVEIRRTPPSESV